jgi:hypothetical protein
VLSSSPAARSTNPHWREQTHKHWRADGQAAGSQQSKVCECAAGRTTHTGGPLYWTARTAASTGSKPDKKVVLQKQPHLWPLATACLCEQVRRAKPRCMPRSHACGGQRTALGRSDARGTLLTSTNPVSTLWAPIRRPAKPTQTLKEVRPAQPQPDQPSKCGSLRVRSPSQGAITLHTMCTHIHAATASACAPPGTNTCGATVQPMQTPSLHAACHCPASRICAHPGPRPAPAAAAACLHFTTQRRRHTPCCPWPLNPTNESASNPACMPRFIQSSSVITLHGWTRAVHREEASFVVTTMDCGTRAQASQSSSHVMSRHVVVDNVFPPNSMHAGSTRHWPAPYTAKHPHCVLSNSDASHTCSLSTAQHSIALRRRATFSSKHPCWQLV